MRRPLVIREQVTIKSESGIRGCCSSGFDEEIPRQLTAHVLVAEYKQVIHEFNAVMAKSDTLVNSRIITLF